MQIDARLLRWGLPIPAFSLLSILGAFHSPPATAGPQEPFSHPRPSTEVAVPTNSPLTMEEAARLATVDQPLLAEREAKIQAEEHQAVAAAQLPDPQVSGGIKELPIDTSEAFSARRDNFTEFAIGVSQEFPRAAKRR